MWKSLETSSQFWVEDCRQSDSCLVFFFFFFFFGAISLIPALVFFTGAVWGQPHRRWITDWPVFVFLSIFLLFLGGGLFASISTLSTLQSHWRQYNTYFWLAFRSCDKCSVFSMFVLFFCFFFCSFVFSVCRVASRHVLYWWNWVYTLVCVLPIYKCFLYLLAQKKKNTFYRNLCFDRVKKNSSAPAHDSHIYEFYLNIFI